MLDAVHVLLYAYEAYTNVTSCYKEFHFVSFMYVNFPSRLSAGKWKTSKIPLLSHRLSISHTPRPMYTAPGPLALCPKLRRVFLVSVRGGDGVITSTQFTCFHRPIFFCSSSSLLQRIKFWSTFMTERTKKRKSNYERKEKFNILFHSFLILVSLLFLFLRISFSLFSVPVSVTNLIVTCKHFA
jgi:hypothetical protein